MPLSFSGSMPRSHRISFTLSWNRTPQPSKPRHGCVEFFRITAIPVRFPSSKNFPPPSWQISPESRLTVNV
ncbi:hypothetical protein ACS0TY_000113 [Phlomoides rotata]